MKGNFRFAAWCCCVVLLGACANNKGSFDLDDVRTTPPPAPPKPPAAYNDEQTTPREREAQLAALMQPGLGFAAKIPRKSSGIAGSYNQEQADIRPQDILALDNAFGTLPLKDALDAHPSRSKEVLLHSHDNFGAPRQRNLRYVRSGWVVDTAATFQIIEADPNIPNDVKKVYTGQLGHVYYHGTQPSKSLPAAAVRYNGTWDFVTNAKRGRKRGTFGGTSGIGSNYGATSLDEYENVNTDPGKGAVAHSSEFEVDFAAKTMTGKLLRNHPVIRDKKQEITERYRVNAKLSGNRFRGSVTASDTDDPYFGSHANTLEGGFFGPNAEELAGKFLADDHSLFGVFAAKRDEGAATESAFDAERIDLNNLAKTSGDTFGNAHTLVLDGKAFALAPAQDGSRPFVHSRTHDLGTSGSLNVHVCCGNLDYLAFGSYGKGTEGAYFFNGERTPLAEVAQKSGTAHYRGTWSAKILSKDQRGWSTDAGNGAGGSRALFDFDFKEKRFTGKLIGEGSADAFPAFKLEGKINGNGFSGTAETAEKGFNLDPKSTGSAAIVHIDADINGAFYGPDAAEIGGTIHSKQNGKDQVGGVFGAKRQTVAP
ncbi:transferrin-binding protein-like solute binding protein [Conchiformibius kuhniae]|uniref:Transferrin-binding protein B n=1 Tax=Conchiformibius kuhniae TaxID=211502 RepID=A0A8T9MTF9_9NEIS|nr:transferrin-binding protein-like solute binding protein [Conchiformibius kuhniae]